MKRLSALVLLVSALFLGTLTLAVNTVPQFIFHLVWEAPPSPFGYTNYIEPTNWAFNLYSTTVLGTPSNQFSFALCLTNWVLGPTDVQSGLQWYTSAPIVWAPGQYFMELTTTNSNGESTYSNITNNPPWPMPAQNLGIRH